jgi:hypothetical protein
MGILAAFTELIVQSHIPGILSILPALPTVLRVAGGSVDGIAARGNTIVSVTWMGCQPICDLHDRGGVGTITSLTVTSLKPSPLFTLSPDLQPVRDTTTSKKPHFHHHRIRNIDEEITQHALPSRDKIRIGGYRELVNTTPGYFEWKEDALRYNYLRPEYAQPEADGRVAADVFLKDYNAPVNDIVIVYPRSKHPLVLQSSSPATSIIEAGGSAGPTLDEEALRATATKLGVAARPCAVPLEFSDALMKEYPQLTPTVLPQILLSNFVSPPSRTAHFSSILVRVYRFPCEMSFVPVE